MATTGSPTDSAQCIVCHGRRFRPYRSIHSQINAIPDGLDRGHTVDVTLSRCADCGVLRLERQCDRPLERLYVDDSISYRAAFSKLREPVAESIYSVDEFDFIDGPPGRLLDVGCSSGYFLRRARERRWAVTGIDLDQRAVDYARAELGLDVRCATLESAGFAPASFDLVTLWGVLEHFPDPACQLRFIRAILRDGGRLVVGVPNVRSLNQMVARLSRDDWDMLLEPGHLHHFNADTLTRLIKPAGFERAGWGTATCAIRGKIPFLPWRVPRLERRIRALTADRAAGRSGYRFLLRSLDRLRLGDVLIATFTKA